MHGGSEVKAAATRGRMVTPDLTGFLPDTR